MEHALLTQVPLELPMWLEILTAKLGLMINVKLALKELILMLLEFAKMLIISVTHGTPLMDYVSPAMPDM